MGKYIEIEKRLEVAKLKLKEYSKSLNNENELIEEILEDVTQAHKLTKALRTQNTTRAKKQRKAHEDYLKMREELKNY